MANFKLIGNKVDRHDAWAKVKGEQAYSDDFAMPGMIYGKVVRSAHAANHLAVDHTRQGGSQRSCCRHHQIHRCGRSQKLPRCSLRTDCKRFDG